MVEVNLHAASSEKFVSALVEHLVALATHQPDQKVDHLPRPASECALYSGVVVNWVKEQIADFISCPWKIYAIKHNTKNDKKGPNDRLRDLSHLGVDLFLPSAIHYALAHEYNMVIQHHQNSIKPFFLASVLERIEAHVRNRANQHYHKSKFCLELMLIRKKDTHKEQRCQMNRNYNSRWE